MDKINGFAFIYLLLMVSSFCVALIFFFLGLSKFNNESKQKGEKSSLLLIFNKEIFVSIIILISSLFIGNLLTLFGYYLGFIDITIEAHFVHAATVIVLSLSMFTSVGLLISAIFFKKGCDNQNSKLLFASSLILVISFLFFVTIGVLNNLSGDSGGPVFFFIDLPAIIFIFVNIVRRVRIFKTYFEDPKKLAFSKPFCIIFLVFIIYRILKEIFFYAFLKLWGPLYTNFKMIPLFLLLIIASIILFKLYKSQFNTVENIVIKSNVVNKETKELLNKNTETTKKRKLAPLFISLGSALSFIIVIVIVIFYFPACGTVGPDHTAAYPTYPIDDVNYLISNQQYDEAESILKNITDSDEEVDRLKNLCQAGKCFRDGDYEGGFDYMIAADGYVIVEYDPNGGYNHFGSERIDSSNPNINNEATRNEGTFTYWEAIDHQIFPELNKANLSLLAHYDNESSDGIYELSLISVGYGYATGEGHYYSDEYVTIQAIPDTGYSFYCWAYRDTDDSMNILSFDNPYTFLMPNYDYELYAYFEVDNNSTMNNGTTPILSEDNKTITYGLYPQSNVNDSSLIDSLNELTTTESNGWYLYEGEYYAKRTAYPYSSSYQFDNGTTIVEGNTYWFKCEPITWEILSIDNGEYYLLSSLLLDTQAYGNSISDYYDNGKIVYPNNYGHSDIRVWLSMYFYKPAFSLDNSHLILTTVDNSASTTSNSSSAYASDNTEGYVFLPSYKDYYNSSYGFNFNSDRCCRTTDWARARGAYCSTKSEYLYNGEYWTRSPGDTPKMSYAISESGSIGQNSIYNSECAVRPAITLVL